MEALEAATRRAAEMIGADADAIAATLGAYGASRVLTTGDLGSLDPQGNLVLTRNKDGSLQTPWGTMRKRD